MYQAGEQDLSGTLENRHKPDICGPLTRLPAERVEQVEWADRSMQQCPRAYYHSAQLHRAEAQARAILERHPAEEYAHLLLGRTLQRQSRHAEAVPHLRIAEAMSGQTIL